jgi:hypothetical protein
MHLRALIAAAAVAAIAAGVIGVLVFRAPRLRHDPDCRDHAPADGVYIPVLTELAAPSPCDRETTDERWTRLVLLGGSALGGAVGLIALAAIALRRRQVPPPLPLDRGFPR